jgi:hypothetical protein
MLNHKNIQKGSIVDFSKILFRNGWNPGVCLVLNFEILLWKNSPSKITLKVLCCGEEQMRNFNIAVTEEKLLMIL